jgi:hypothetical protein
VVQASIETQHQSSILFDELLGNTRGLCGGVTGCPRVKKVNSRIPHYGVVLQF